MNWATEEPSTFNLSSYFLAQREMAVGRSESCRALTNFSISSWTGPDGWSFSKKKTLQSGRQHINHSFSDKLLQSRCDARHKIWDKYRSFTTANGFKLGTNMVRWQVPAVGVPCACLSRPGRLFSDPLYQSIIANYPFPSLLY